jgi:hypothetical protein
VSADVEAGEPDRLTSLPRYPLSLRQVKVVQRAVENIKDANTTVWIGDQPDSVMLDRGASVLKSGEATVLEFVVECETAYRAYRYEPAPSGGHWMRFEAAKKGAVGGDVWEQTIEEESYTPLGELVDGRDDE